MTVHILTFETSGQINRLSLSLWEGKITVVGSVDIPTTRLLTDYHTYVGIILNVCMTRQFDDHYLLEIFVMLVNCSSMFHIQATTKSTY